MRKISKSRGDDDVVSSTNGSGSVAEADEVQPEQPPPDEDNKEDNDGKEDDLEKEDNGVEQELDEEEEEASAKKSKSKSKAKPKKKKSDKAKKAAKDEEYEVEKIIDSKRIKGKIYYLIRWKGYSADSDTWEPQHTVSCPDLISKYNEEKENSKNDSPKRGKKRKATSKKVNKSPAKRTKSSWDSEKADENEEYEVERILEVQFKKNGQRQFLIHWKGWSSKFDSWEPENNLNCPDLIKKFMDKVEAARKLDSRNLRVAPGTTNRFTLQSPTSGRRLSKRRGQRQRVRYDDAE
ncbi:chromobox protein homolog 1-like [Aricia agestis]|uniref:chromobox protein homolog 1-like n=1 Tax=Aricia agestis TaxID=91739 RepID=UPI001C208AFD|nr:chromobox protein homolog 1-like [Aricia agestis]